MPEMVVRSVPQKNDLKRMKNKEPQDDLEFFTSSFSNIDFTL